MKRNIDLLRVANKKILGNSKSGFRSSNSNEPGNLPAQGWIPGTNISESMPSFARKGRRGDNKIREIDGEPSHVNTTEADAIDTFGPLGKAWVKSVGAGTTNPKTGLKEYWPKFLTPPKKVREGVTDALTSMAAGDWEGVGDAIGDIGSGIKDRSLGGDLWDKHVKRGSLVRGLTGDSTWKPNEGKWGIFGQTGASRDRDAEAIAETKRANTFDAFISGNKGVDIADKYMEGDDVKQWAMEGSGMTSEDFDRYIDPYDDRKETELGEDYLRDIERLDLQEDSLDLANRDIGNQTSGDMFGLLTTSKMKEGVGFAGQGNFGDDFKMQSVLDSAKSKYDKTAIDREGIGIETEQAIADRDSGIQDVQDEYNDKFWEQMDAWDTVKSA